MRQLKENKQLKKLQSVALVSQGTSEKKDTKEVYEENALAVRHMKKFVSQEIERRNAKEQLKSCKVLLWFLKVLLKRKIPKMHLKKCSCSKTHEEIHESRD